MLKRVKIVVIAQVTVIYRMWNCEFHFSCFV